jgi:hypothetical protein
MPLYILPAEPFRGQDWISSKGTDFSLFHGVEINTGDYRVSYPAGTVCSLIRNTEGNVKLSL